MASRFEQIAIGVTIVIIGYVITRPSMPGTTGGGFTPYHPRPPVYPASWATTGGGPTSYRDYTNLKVGHKLDGTPYILGGL